MDVNWDVKAIDSYAQFIKRPMSSALLHVDVSGNVFVIIIMIMK